MMRKTALVTTAFVLTLTGCNACNSMRQSVTGLFRGCGRANNVGAPCDAGCEMGAAAPCDPCAQSSARRDCRRRDHRLACRFHNQHHPIGIVHRFPDSCSRSTHGNGSPQARELDPYRRFLVGRGHFTTSRKLIPGPKCGNSNIALKLGIKIS
jgi:hypothetical protein